MKKYLWLLLPATSFWIGWGIDWNFIGNDTDEWWHLPSKATLLFIFLASLCFAVNKIGDY